MSKEREALKLALEALRMPCDRWNKTQAIKVQEAIKAGEEALAQPEQEPVAWQLVFDDGHTEITTRPVANWKRLMWESAGKRWDTVPLYTTPPQRTWVGLTDEEIVACWARPDMFAIEHAIEAKLKEKNK